MFRELRLTAVVMALLFVCSSAQAAPVWFSDNQGVHQVNADTNQVSLNLALDQVAALGVNPQDGSVWALSAASLVKYAANGSTLLQLDLKTLANDFGASRLLSVDSYDGSVWLAGNKRLLHLNQNGAVLASLVTPVVMQDLTVAQDESLWILGQTQLLHYAAQGGLLASFNLPAAMQKTQYLAVDDSAKVIWLAGEKQLFQLNLDQPSQTLLTLTLSEVAVGLALNPQDNSAWLAGQNTLTAYALNGGLLHTANLPPKLTNPIALVFDYASNGLWLGHIGGLSRFDVRGNYLATIPANVRVTAIGKSPFVIPVPTVALVNPPDHGLINNPKPPLQLIYGALCAGQPCRFPNSYYSGYRLSALLNAQQIGLSFIFDPVTALSSYTPSVRLPEGINTISAQVTDQNGRISELLNASFTLDTIPPKFLNITPADKSVFQVPQITIQGSVDDPQVYVVLGNYTGPGTNPAKQNFSYPVTLALGGNTFNLSAYDLAGNLATLALTYTYSPLLITIGSPAPNAVIDAKTATVTGSFSGATTATVNVNGVNATVTGTSYGATVPLIYGSNTLTVSATAPNGATASQSVTVTSTFPGISIVSPANGATLNGDNALVSGTVQAPPNSNIGVVVNGVIALVDANNNFYANNVPLTAGANTITATVTNLKGQSNTASVTVNATGFSPFSITADPVQGFAPMTVAFTATSNTGNRIVSWQANPGAAGALDTTDPTVLFKFTYTQPGIYQANVTVTDSAGTTYTKTIVIQVQDLAQMDAMFKAMWSGMNDALVAGDKAAAMIYLNSQAQAKYGPVFDALMPSISKIVSSYSSLQRASISSSIGEYAIRRTANGAYRIYLINFLRGADGVWHIDEM